MGVSRMDEMIDKRNTRDGPAGSRITAGHYMEVHASHATSTGTVERGVDSTDEARHTRTA